MHQSNKLRAKRLIWLGGISLVIAVGGLYQLRTQDRSLQAKTEQPPAVPSSPTAAIPASTSSWVVSAHQAQRLIAQGATILDARPHRPWVRQRLVGAIATQWQDFSPSTPAQRGRLLSDDAVLSQKLQALGISQDKPVVVVGDPVKGWGEDGRLVWMLRTLGHPHAVFVDGGHAALVTLGLPTSAKAATSTAGDFVVARTPTWTIDQEVLRIKLQTQNDSSNWVVIDAREQREYEGATPYGERRGGHIPGAVHLHYRDLLHGAGQRSGHLPRPSSEKRGSQPMISWSFTALGAFAPLGSQPFYPIWGLKFKTTQGRCGNGQLVQLTPIP